MYNIKKRSRVEIIILSISEKEMLSTYSIVLKDIYESNSAIDKCPRKAETHENFQTGN